MALAYPGIQAFSVYSRPLEDEAHAQDATVTSLSSDGNGQSPLKQAATPRTITMAIESFASFSVTISRTENFPSGIGTPYIYRLSFLVDRGASVSNVTVTPTGGGVCNVLSNQDISCTGVLTSLLIGYQYSYTPTLVPPHILLDVGGSDTTRVDYTIVVTYPSSLTFVDSSVPPNSHNLATRTLDWTLNNAFQLRPVVRFLSADLRGIWLPLVQR